MTLGKYLKNCREKSDVTQAYLGEKLGYHAQFVSNVERDLAKPPLPVFKKWIFWINADRDIVKEILIDSYKAKIERHF